MKIEEAKTALDKVIRKARVHFYKPIQIAEVLHKHRIDKSINLNNVEDYRTYSRKWRNEISIRFAGQISTSSARYQDDLFNDNATPPAVLAKLGEENTKKGGIVEAYIYRKLRKKNEQMIKTLHKVTHASKQTFEINDFVSSFLYEPGLKRSIGKIFEIVVHSIFSVLVEELDVVVEVYIDESKIGILQEFEDFTKRVLGIDANNPRARTVASLCRAGVTNAADKGLDVVTNFGPVIQIKHLTLNEQLAEDIVGSIEFDRIIIICKSAEKEVIVSLCSQLGWKSRIQSIITEDDLEIWYTKALRGKYSDTLGDKLLECLSNDIIAEFPMSDPTDFDDFFSERGYDDLSDTYWI